MFIAGLIYLGEEVNHESKAEDEIYDSGRSHYAG